MKTYIIIEIQIVTGFEKWYWMIKKCSYFIVTASAIALITMAFRGVETTLIHNEFYKVNEPLAYNVPTSKNTIERINEELGLS